LKLWDERKDKNVQFNAIIGSAQQQFFAIPKGIVFGFGLPPIQGLGTAGGFEFMLEDRADGSTAELAAMSDRFVAETQKHTEFALVQSIFRDTVPQYTVDLDSDKAQTMGIPVTDLYNALQTFLGGLYVNDFNRFGRTCKSCSRLNLSIATRPAISTGSMCGRLTMTWCRSPRWFRWSR